MPLRTARATPSTARVSPKVLARPEASMARSECESNTDTPCPDRETGTLRVALLILLLVMANPTIYLSILPAVAVPGPARRTGSEWMQARTGPPPGGLGCGGPLGFSLAAPPPRWAPPAPP